MSSDLYTVTSGCMGLLYVCVYIPVRKVFDPQQRRTDFSSSLCDQTGSGDHPAFYTMGTGGSFPGAKTWTGHDADHSPPSSAEVENE
jgi:hypothetical protein